MKEEIKAGDTVEVISSDNGGCSANVGERHAIVGVRVYNYKLNVGVSPYIRKDAVKLINKTMNKKEAINKLETIEGQLTEIRKVLESSDKLEVGKWYKLPLLGEGLLMGVFGGYGFSNKTYGFSTNGTWSTGIQFNIGDDFILATYKEVETALIKEAKKRGFKKGVKYNTAHGHDSECSFRGYVYASSCNTLSGDNHRNDCMFKGGKWATIIETETVEMTVEEVSKVLGKEIKIVK